MSSYSKQELDVNVKVLESKVEFIMKAFNIANPLSPFSPPKTLLQVYYEVKSGIPLAQAVDALPVDDAVDVSVEAE